LSSPARSSVASGHPTQPPAAATQGQLNPLFRLRLRKTGAFTDVTRRLSPIRRSEWPKLESWQLEANSRKAANGGPSAKIRVVFEIQSAWLARGDSNLKMGDLVRSDPQ
jgi:hypothetical protein